MSEPERRGRRREENPVARLTAAQRRVLLSTNRDGVITEPRGGARALMPFEALIERGMLERIPPRHWSERIRYRRTRAGDAWVALWQTNHPDRPVRYYSPFAPSAKPVHMRFDLARKQLREDEIRWDELSAANALSDAHRAHGRPYISELLR